MLVDADQAADRGVGREAVAAAVFLGHGKRDLLVQLAGQGLAERAVQLDPALEHGRVSGHRSRHVRGHAEGGLDPVQ